MRGITIWQPWATMLAAGIKKYETRSWPSHYRGPIGLHAAAKPISEVAKLIPHASMLHLRNRVYTTLEDLPLGAVVGTAQLVACHLITQDFVNSLPAGEDKLGDFTLGRFAWEFDQRRCLPEPIPVKGAQGLWVWDKPLRENCGMQCTVCPALHVYGYCAKSDKEVPVNGEK